VDNKTILDLSDDAAYMNWGGSWRMPTAAEAEELVKECHGWFTTQNGVKGFIFFSKKNDNSIFLPAGGWYVDRVLYHQGSEVKYWTSSADVYMSKGWDSMGVNYASGIRTIGVPIRPVCP
jgi:hypothetical protein